jgi:hypothetical protein
MTQQCKRENVRFRSIRWSVATRVHFIRVVKRAGQGRALVFDFQTACLGPLVNTVCVLQTCPEVSMMAVSDH